ncbi:hypothetical protein [Cypionkella sp.]|uniref:hypothetical protein n=1 Tax=Cypionkella sp. TaxID=2811411 RepID=UPI00263193DE|nr:hypothetical protein [Cypionkella sp.]
MPFGFSKNAATRKFDRIILQLINAIEFSGLVRIFNFFVIHELSENLSLARVLGMARLISPIDLSNDGEIRLPNIGPTAHHVWRKRHNQNA